MRHGAQFPVLGYYGCDYVNQIAMSGCSGFWFICIGCDSEFNYGYLNGSCNSAINKDFSILFVPNN